MSLVPQVFNKSPFHICISAEKGKRKSPLKTNNVEFPVAAPAPDAALEDRFGGLSIFDEGDNVVNDEELGVQHIIRDHFQSTRRYI